MISRYLLRSRTFPQFKPRMLIQSATILHARLLAVFLKTNYALPVRINTNGLADLINKRPVAPLLAGKIDTLSISLNSSNPEIYEKTVRPVFKEKAFPAMLAFAQEAKKYVPKVILTTVATTITKEDEEECTRLCERLGVTHRIRKFVEIK